MEWALMTLVKQHLEDYLEGLETNFDTSKSPMTLRHVKIKEDSVRRDVLKIGKSEGSPFEFQNGTIGSIEFHMSWLGNLQVYATDVVLNLQMNPLKALSQAVTNSARPRVIDPQHAIDLAQPRYCDAHTPVHCRQKVAERWSQCSSCQIRLQTNYAQLSLCPICSQRELRCMLCGSSAPSDPVATVGSSTSGSLPLWGGDGPRSNIATSAPASPDKSLFGRNLGLSSASSVLSSYLKRPAGDGALCLREWKSGDKVAIKGLPQKFEKFNGEKGTIAKVDDGGGMCLVYLDNLQLGHREVSVPVDNLLLWKDAAVPSNTSSFQGQKEPQPPRSHSPGIGVASEALLSRPMMTPPRLGASGSTPGRNSGMVNATSVPDTPIRGYPVTPPRVARGTEPSHLSRIPDTFLEQPAPHSMPPNQQIPAVPTAGNHHQPPSNMKATVRPPAVVPPMPNRAKQERVTTPRSEEAPPHGQQWASDTNTQGSVDHHRKHAMHYVAPVGHDDRGAIAREDSWVTPDSPTHSDSLEDSKQHDLSRGRGRQHDAVIPDDGRNRVRSSMMTHDGDALFADQPEATPPYTQSGSDRSANNMHFRVNSRGQDRLSVHVPDQHRQDMELALRLEREEQEAAKSRSRGKDAGFTPQSSPSTSGSAKKHNPLALDSHW